MTRIILLDIDGVLVQPGGYRAALRSTVQRFVGNYHIEEGLLTDLEKRGISSEWDMAPLIIAAYWDSVLSRQGMENLSEDVTLAAKQIQQCNADLPNRLSIPEFELIAGQYPAESALYAGCFSSIPYNLRKNLLTETRNVNVSHTMRVFQQLTLGRKGFTETYNLPAEIESESFLLKYDISNIDEDVHGFLYRSNHYLAAFTGRPSGIPRGVMETESVIGFAPEAELALELINMTDIPLTAFGGLEYVASARKLDPVTLLKPSPVHALAAIAAAYIRDEYSALQAAVDWQQSGRLTGAFLDLPRTFELIVVEDTMGGIDSTLKAGEILRDTGFDVIVRPFGLTSGSSAKAMAFQQAGIPFFDHWESLIRTIDS